MTVYCGTNPTSLRNVAFDCLTSQYTQLASRFMQLAAAGRRCNKVHFHCVFESKMLKCIRMGITIFKIFICGGLSSDIRSEITFYGSAYTLP